MLSTSHRPVLTDVWAWDTLLSTQPGGQPVWRRPESQRRWAAGVRSGGLEVALNGVPSGLDGGWGPEGGRSGAAGNSRLGLRAALRVAAGSARNCLDGGVHAEGAGCGGVSQTADDGIARGGAAVRVGDADISVLVPSSMQHAEAQNVAQN
jgi:hypothetical protein